MLQSLEYAGAPFYRGLRRLKNRALNLVDPPVIVLAYHRVTQLQSDPHQLAVTPDNFRAQLQFLGRNCRLVRFEDDWAAVRKPAVAITFDDGYADNVSQALPLLEEAALPATFFISTGIFTGNAEFWSDDLERLILSEGEYPDVFSLQDGEYGAVYPSTSRADRLLLHDRLHGCMLQLPPRRREEWLAQLRTWAGISREAREAYRPMTTAEVRLLAASPLVTIGAHGVTHTPLALLAAEEQRQEMVESRRVLEELLTRKVTVFSYPFGGKGQYDRTTRRLCREAGFKRAVTTFPGQAHRWTDPWQMPRQLVRNWDLDTFAAMMERFRV